MNKHCWDSFSQGALARFHTSIHEYNDDDKLLHEYEYVL